ncbi:hypothetical protein BN946_scf185011.g22 [Trametes cinnabarina]|uniref:Uncharacterized protein n=1 Tax=Pycnoporus cinnabarinus TaxID=5643 RepID=A0A060SV86_PYCCI|nr:hypothetical protein BN946_scf185011.g22 [Trametes cinnabarina]
MASSDQNARPSDRVESLHNSEGSKSPKTVDPREIFADPESGLYPWEAPSGFRETQDVATPRPRVFPGPDAIRRVFLPQLSQRTRERDGIVSSVRPDQTDSGDDAVNGGAGPSTLRQKGKAVARAKTRATRAKPYARPVRARPTPSTSTSGTRGGPVRPATIIDQYRPRAPGDDWAWNGVPIPQDVSGAELWDYLVREHGVKSTSTTDTCPWTGCKASIGWNGLRKHVEGVHLKRKAFCTECKQSKRWDLWANIRHSSDCGAKKQARKRSKKTKAQQQRQVTAHKSEAEEASEPESEEEMELKEAEEEEEEMEEEEEDQMQEDVETSEDASQREEPAAAVVLRGYADYPELEGYETGSSTEEGSGDE